MMGAVGHLIGLSGSFFRWWSGELAALVPSALRERLSSGGPRLILDMSATPPQLYRLHGRKAVPVDGTKTSQQSGKAALTLTLPPTEIVTRRAQLPLAAEENLPQVIGFEMDRLTPFSQEEVYYACRIAARDSKNGRLDVEILLSPRQKVDPLLSELRDQGCRVTAVDITADGPGRTLGVNLLPETVKAASSPIGKIIGGALTAAAAVLLFVALQIPLERKQGYADALGERVAEERARVAVLHRLEADIAQLQTQDTSLQSLKHQDALTLALLDQVTRLLPDDAWLSQLNLKGDRLELGGFSPSSSKLITTFEQSPLFTEAVFRAPVTQDPRLGLERFSLSMRVRQAEAMQ